MADREGREYGRLEWFFYIIVLPLLFTGLVSGLVLQIMGYDVTGKLMSIARHTPVISRIIPPDEATKQEQSEIRKLQAQLDQIKKELEASQQANGKLNEDLAAKENEINSLKQKIELMNKQETDRQLADEYWKGQAQLYSNMSPGKAAAILSELPKDQAMAILGRMRNDARAGILEKMDPKVAANLSN